MKKREKIESRRTSVSIADILVAALVTVSISHFFSHLNFTKKPRLPDEKEKNYGQLSIHEYKIVQT